MSSHVSAAVVLLRNVNLGHLGSPSRSQLETVFEDSGAQRVQNIQSNGTLIITATAPDRVLRSAIDQLQRDLDRRVQAIMLTCTQFTAMVQELPAPALEDGAYREVITFFDPLSTASTLPPSPPRVRFLRQGPGWAQSWIWKDGNAVGQPAAAVEAHLKTTATSRTRRTVDRVHTELLRRRT